MKTILLPLFLMLISFGAQAQGDPVEPIEEKDPALSYAEQMPLWQGCDSLTESSEQMNCSNSAMVAFISNNMHVPYDMTENTRSYVSFVIEKDGSVSNIKVLKSGGASADKEAMRVVGLMPAWVPGKQKGQPVRVKYTLPISFVLN